MTALACYQLYVFAQIASRYMGSLHARDNNKGVFDIYLAFPMVKVR